MVVKSSSYSYYNFCFIRATETDLNLVSDLLFSYILGESTIQNIMNQSYITLSLFLNILSSSLFSSLYELSLVFSNISSIDLVLISFYNLILGNYIIFADFLM